MRCSTDATNTITFLPGLLGQINLTADLPKIGKPVDIQGPGAARPSELARAVGRVTGRPVRLVPVPPGLLAAVAALAGKREGGEAVFSPLTTRDDAELRRLVGWHPEADLDANLGWLRG